MSAPQPSQWIATARPSGEAAEHGLRHEEAHLDVLRRQHAHHRAARGHPFALAIQRVEHPARLRRDHRGLAQPPRRLFERRARRGHLRLLRLQLIAAARQACDLELALQLPHVRGVGGLRRAAVIELLARDAADLELRLVARQLRRRCSASRPVLARAVRASHPAPAAACPRACRRDAPRPASGASCACRCAAARSTASRTKRRALALISSPRFTRSDRDGRSPMSRR